MKRNAGEPATKDDLERFATKDDLERFATKDDLERFATKDDLEKFATKTDLIEFKDELCQEMGGFKDELRQEMGGFKEELRQEMGGFKEELRQEMGGFKDELRQEMGGFKDELRQEMRGFKSRVALDAIEVRADVGALGEKLSKLILQTRSDLMGAVESAIFKAEKVDRAQILTGDRIGLLEGRVAALESPQRPQHP